MGPEPVLLSRKQVDTLYDVLGVVKEALDSLKVPYVVTGGSLLGAVRQHSILFCDDDIDVAVIESKEGNYDNVRSKLQRLLGDDYSYTVKPWEGGDRIRRRSVSNVFVDLFCIREYTSEEELREVIAVKKNGQPQSEEYVTGIMETMQQAAVSQGETSPLFPCWHFDTRKAIELWPKEVYREHELFPLCENYNMGPLTNISGPRMPVLLLGRAFGPDCFEVYYQSHSHGRMADSSHHEANGGNLKPVVAAGGTWEGNEKMPLKEEHYVPMQPVSRAKRRPTLHNKERLLEYLQQQSGREASCLAQHESGAASQRPHQTVYMDGVFDLFHVGHLEAIQQCAALGDRVIIGVTGDADAANYKRPPVISQENRVSIVEAINNVDKVVCPCPLVVTQEFMEENGIDLVVHGFANDEDAKRQKVFFEYPMASGKFQRIGYYKGLSTTDIISKIQGLGGDEDAAPAKQSKWFGASLAAATRNAPNIPYDPFPLELRVAIEPHIRKATVRRREALSAIREASCLSQPDFDSVIGSPLAVEADFEFDAEQYSLRAALLQCTKLSMDADLTKLHTNSMAKNSLLRALTTNFRDFQQVYDNFVLSICVPRMASLVDCDKMYYQAFPCLRIIQPGEFSIGPHADVTYGHHPCSINFYVPLTKIDGAASLFLESRPGSEDWHPISGDYGDVKQFAGATCLHWTPENMTNYTRVSLDFRVITGPMFDALSCGGDLKGGQVDVYRRSPGYYNCCRKRDGIWYREGELLKPDARVGFPWTVKDWDKHLQNKQKDTRRDTQS